MLFRYELRRFRSGLPLLALIFVLLVPAIYGALYLAANWDPYGNMERLPVAIVNEDRPVEFEGRTLTTGADITRELREDHAFDWRETSREEAEEGLREGRYYLVLDIPAELSADLVSPSADAGSPEQAQITLHRDDSNGFVIGSVTASSQSKIENSVDQAAVEAYFQAVFANLGTLREGMVEASDGAAQLADGAGEAHDGSGTLKDGLVQAKDGSAKLADGAAQAREGSQQLASGGADLKDGGDRLASGAADAEQGAGALQEGAAQAREGSQALADGAGELNANVPALRDGATGLKDGLDQLSAGSGQLVDGLDQAREGSQALAAGAGELDANVPALRDGATGLKDGLDQLSTGSADLTDGAVQVADGTQELYDTVVPRLDTVIERQDAVAQDVAAVDADVQRLNEAVGTADTRVSGTLGTAQEQLDALAAQSPELAETPAYAALAQTLADAAERSAAVEARSQELAESTAAADERVQSAVEQDVAGDAKEKLTRLNEGAHAVAAGADELHTGIAQADEGAGALAAGVGRFSDGLTALGDGATQLDAGLAALQEGAGSLQTGIAQADEGAGTLADGVGRFSDGLTALADGATQLNGGLVQLDEGAATLHTGLGDLTTGAGALAEGAGRLAEGAGTLDSGLGELATGSTDLDSGLGELSDGAGRLDEGLQSLDDGSHTLATKLDEGADRIPALSEDQRDEAALVMSQPVEVSMEVQNAAEVYGRGMAPMFFSIALWVFGIAAFNIMRPVSGRMLAGRRRPLALALSAWLPVGLLAFGGGLVMMLATLPMGLAPAHPVRLVALIIVTAAVFSLIAHLLQTAVGTPGSAALLVLLILQLASTGGTYPAAVLPGFFRWLHPFMPMTYTIEAFRQTISGGLDSHFWGPLAVLLAIGAVALALDVLVVRRRQRFRMKDLHPALEK